jgi:UPF0755 protein
MKSLKSFLLGGLLAAVAMAILGVGLYWFQVYTPATNTDKRVVVDIPQGSSAYSIAKRLEQRGIINSARFFYYHVKISGEASKLRAGAFLLSPGYSPAKIANILQNDSGAANLIRVTIPEGYNIWDIGDVLQDKGLVLSKSFSDYAHTKAKYDFQDEFPFLKAIPLDTVEGYLFPETYYFSPTSTVETIVRTMLKQFETVALPIWESAPTTPGSPKSRFSFHQILCVASLIEKEARVRREMPTISSVFYNRLKKRMPLASDPTVVYAHGKSYKKRVYYKHLKIDSPYNTYKNSGFTPTPIASMGKRAIEASLSPADTPYYFFVANKDGTHTFTETYREHLRVQNKK